MRILARKLSKEEAILVCERMKLVAIIKPRLFEILDLECDPKDDPLAQRLFGALLRGNLVLVDDSQRKVNAWDPENFPPLELIPPRFHRLRNPLDQPRKHNPARPTVSPRLCGTASRTRLRRHQHLAPRTNRVGPSSRNQTNGSWQTQSQRMLPLSGHL